MFTASLHPPPEPLAGHLRMGEDPGRTPDAIIATSTHLLRGGRPWFPVMGEFHFSRYPRDAWREELLSLRAGGVDVVATYLFWHHHEEARGTFRFDGRRDVRAFLEAAADCALDAVVRIGPWAHGEARYGGFPDWLVDLDVAHRTDDPGYLELVRPYYEQIAAQLRGLYHADGGPIVAVQVENELYDQPEHLRTLKRTAIEAGITPALWTATAWGRAELPADEFLPLYSGYSESPWDDAHPGWARHNRRHYFFQPVRDDHTVGADLRRTVPEGAGPDPTRYPFATCELGGGVQPTYHRRVLVEPDDVAALALTKLGCGSSWQGYYMFHGGSHPTDGATTMQESLITGYPNDLPVVNYDFQAPLGEYGQVRPSFARLRLQHHLLHAAGTQLAPACFVEPDHGPRDLDDRDTLRWSVRTDGRSGFIFVNNHQPGGEELAAHTGVRFGLTDAAGAELVLPSEPVDIPTGAYFAWPFRFELPGGVVLEWASAQLVAVLDDLVVLTQTASVPVELAFAGPIDGDIGGGDIGGGDIGGGQALGDGVVRVRVPQPGRDAVVHAGGLRFLVLDEASALALTIGELWGRRRLVIGDGVHVVPDGTRLYVECGAEGGALAIHPPVDALSAPGAALRDAGSDELFARWTVAPEASASRKVELIELRGADGPAPRRTGGPLERAAAPTDEHFATAAQYGVELDPGDLGGVHRLLLRLNWVGDVGRAEIGGRVVADQFWHGAPWEIDLLRHRADLEEGEPLRLRLLPFDPGAAIHVPEHLRPDRPVLRIDHVELVPVHRFALERAS
ncbi:beta-galactosidase [Actinomycetes bacterium KLBMP 9759]